jgi:hypothetical protein
VHPKRKGRRARRQMPEEPPFSRVPQPDLRVFLKSGAPAYAGLVHWNLARTGDLLDTVKVQATEIGRIISGVLDPVRSVVPGSAGLR